jgi:hypothetical protein
MSRGGWNRGKPKVPGSGRKAGTPNKVTQVHRQALEEMRVDSTDPLSFFMSILKNPDAPMTHRQAAASELLPYCHPKLSSIEARQGGTTHEERLEQARALLEDLDRTEN